MYKIFKINTNKSIKLIFKKYIIYFVFYDFFKILFNESVVGSGSALRQNNSSPRMHTWNLGLPKEGLGKSGEDRRRTEAVK